MNTTRSVLFALLSLGFLAVSANAQNAEGIDRLYQEAKDFYDKGKYREAKANMTRAYTAFERLELKDKAKKVEYLRRLSDISFALQENDKTIEYATEVSVHALTDDDRGFAYRLLGLAYRNKGEYDKAIGYHEKDLAIRIKTLGAQHPRVAANYHNIGLAYAYKGEYDKAIGYYEKDLAIRIKALGAEHPAVSTTYNDIGEVYRQKSEYDKAIGYYEKALAIYLKALGAEHPAVSTSYTDIGGAYRYKGEYDKAIGYHQKALAIRIKTLGAEHPDVGVSYFSIGAVYAKMKRGFFGKHKKSDKKMAMEYLLRAKAILLPKLGAQHPRTKLVQLWIDLLK